MENLDTPQDKKCPQVPNIEHEYTENNNNSDNVIEIEWKKSFVNIQ